MKKVLVFLVLAFSISTIFSMITAHKVTEYDLEKMTHEELIELRIMLNRMLGDEVSEAKATANRPTATKRPTATPKPTATTKPDYSSMKIADAARAICEAASDGVCLLRSIEIDPDVVIIDAEFGRSYNTQSRLIGSVRYTIRIAQEIFKHKDAPMIYLRFHENGRDNYGNQVDMTTITIRLKKATAAKMDLDYMLDSAARTQKLFLDVVDGYSLYKDYKAILE
jgi:hypothetical protein